jgi:hypothetical protein
MNAKQQAFDEIKRLSAMFRGLYDIGSDLAEISSIEQATEEAKRRLDGLRAEEIALLPRVEEYRRLDALLPDRRRALAEIEARLAQIRASL